MSIQGLSFLAGSLVIIALKLLVPSLYDRLAGSSADGFLALLELFDELIHELVDAERDRILLLLVVIGVFALTVEISAHGRRRNLDDANVIASLFELRTQVHAPKMQPCLGAVVDWVDDRDRNEA